MEDNVAIGASDAGLYIGQSKMLWCAVIAPNAMLRASRLRTRSMRMFYDNIATGNTGGILVFNMPALPQDGRRTRVYNNQVFENNHKNFGHKGTPVASVPAGSGIVINSNDQVEIFENDIRDNRTANIIVSSVYSSNYAR